jgi:hypothetical protein
MLRIGHSLAIWVTDLNSESLQLSLSRGGLWWSGLDSHPLTNVVQVLGGLQPATVCFSSDAFLDSY